jgi:hypothetical protein
MKEHAFFVKFPHGRFPNVMRKTIRNLGKFQALMPDLMKSTVEYIQQSLNFQI